MFWIDSRHWKISTSRHFQNGRHNTTQIQHCPISTPFHMWVDYDVLNGFQTLNNFYWSPFTKWPPHYLKNYTLSDIIKIWYVGRKWCTEFIPDIEKFLPVAISKMAATISHKFNIIRFQRHFICGYIMMSWIDSKHRKISTGRHFQNGHHNIAKIQHCPISSQFDMWVDNDVPNWFPILNNFYWSPFSKWPPHYLKNYTLSDIIKIWYVGRKWCTEFIPDIEKFLSVTIFKMDATIPHKFNIVRFQRHFICW